jgi:carbamoyltransferase
MGMKSLYLGPTYDLSDIEGLDTSYEQVANLISNRNIVAIFQGRSEAGPRALGNRSILYDPRDPDGKDHVNTIKKREAFRPFAGTILKEYVHDWFDMAGLEESPFMMYAVDAHPNIQERIPAILHVDYTCRIQTLTREQNEHYYNLIDAFYKQTNVPILFNTSFNLAGEPLVETPEDALKTFNDSEIKYLYFPEIQKLISK